ncbi:unnamed protein product [Laminaria digitata]
MEVEQIIIEGGTLTIASDNTVQFINVAFLIMPGAALVFDTPETLIGPNTPTGEDFPPGSLIEISDDASLTFNGDATLQEVGNVDILLENFGSLEFKKTALIENNINAIPVNTGTIKFRGDTTIRGNDGIGIDNAEGGFVRFSKTATFDDNGIQLEGFDGCNIQNDSISKMSFRGDATFSNTRCTNAEGTPVFNTGIMTFYGKARFNDNTGRGNGGAVLNRLGSMTFRRAVQFNNNACGDYGGGIAVEGGDVTFKKAVKFSGNTADSGGAFAVLSGQIFGSGDVVDSGFGSLTFEKPSVVRFEDNTVDTSNEFVDDDNCTVGEVMEGTTLIGFPSDDVCVAAT